jgi:hypothetical protein
VPGIGTGKRMNGLRKLRPRSITTAPFLPRFLASTSARHTTTPDPQYHGSPAQYIDKSRLSQKSTMQPKRDP